MRHLLMCVMMALMMSATVTASAENLPLRALCDSASAGNPKALYQLAYLHDIGYDSIPVDTLRSTALYRLSAEKGYLPAQNYLGYRLLRGEGVRRDVKEGLHWIELAAIAGDAKAASNLGYLLLHDPYVEKDAEKAVYWLGRAADEGLPVAKSLLAEQYLAGEGVPKDSTAAVALYVGAADGGLEDARTRLAAMLPLDADGKPVNAHPEISDAILSQAYTLLGDSYALGRGVPYSYERSLAYYRAGAELGDERAMRYLEELRGQFPDL